MSDLDFDELDKAVNSLISANKSLSGSAPVASSPATSPVVTAPVPTPIPTPAPTLSSSAAAPVTNPVTTPAPIDKPVVAPQSLASQRASGRFMDVIHPSSDMRATSNTAEPIKPVVTPISPIQETQTPVAKPVEPQAISTPPLESPFIAGAKVEKRPLGAFSSVSLDDKSADSPSAAPEPADPAKDVEANDATSVQAPSEETEAPLPEELQDDLLKIEAGVPVSIEDSTLPEQNSQNNIASQQTPTPEGITSIVQQYKADKPKDDDKPGAIYDTSVYHKPIQTDVKKKAGWLWILWVLLLMVIGVGAGVVAYFYVLPIFK